MEDLKDKTTEASHSQLETVDKDLSELKMEDLKVETPESSHSQLETVDKDLSELKMEDLKDETPEASHSQLETVDKDSLELMEFEIPDGVDISEKNFTSCYVPDDDIPLMPIYGTYQKRLKTFEEMLNPCQEENEALARMGFHFYGNLPVFGIDGTTAKYIERQTGEVITIVNPISAPCFCCGSQVIIEHKFPRDGSTHHHLHCKFLDLLPKEMQDEIKAAKEPVYSGKIEDIDIDRINKLRAEMHPEKKFDKPITRETWCRNKPCLICNERKAVILCPCFHISRCIKCIKGRDKCSSCNQVIKGMIRRV